VFTIATDELVRAVRTERAEHARRAVPRRAPRARWARRRTPGGPR
jgi:hypothetical protein